MCNKECRVNRVSPNLVVGRVARMIESSMYFGIGLLFGALIGLVLIPLVHARAVRLTTRRLEAVLPESMAEVQAEKDLLRAEFAMSTRRLEMTVEQLVNKTTSQVVELSKKDDIINRLKVERDAQEIEIITLKTQVDALK
jgi:hypothetical protein